MPFYRYRYTTRSSVLIVYSSWILQLLNASMLYVQSTSSSLIPVVLLCVPVLFVFITGAIELSVLCLTCITYLICLARF